MVVEIRCRAQRKAFMGGFRHRLTGREFHHAAVQTLPKKRPDRGVDRFSRETQVKVTGCPEKHRRKRDVRQKKVTTESGEKKRLKKKLSRTSRGDELWWVRWI